jgi:hypothetical protein
MPHRYQSLRIIVYGLATGQLAFFAVAYAVQRSVAPPESLDPTVLPVVAVIVLLACVVASVQLGRLLVSRVAQQPDEASRWTAFQSAVIVRLALTEAASFMQIVCYVLTGEWLFILLFVASLGAFLFQRPSEDEWDRIRS